MFATCLALRKVAKCSERLISEQHLARINKLLRKDDGRVDLRERVARESFALSSAAEQNSRETCSRSYAS